MDRWTCHKFARTPLASALSEIRNLVRRSFNDDVVEMGTILQILEDIRKLNLKDAALSVLDLKGGSLFFLRFALEIYGLELVRRTPR